MFINDALFIFQWWFLFLIIGIFFLPLTTLIFSNFFDKGYIFSKIIGILFISYAVFILGILKILLFTQAAIFLTAAFFLIVNCIILFKDNPSQRIILSKNWKIFVFEEILFFIALFFWSYIRGLQPDIHGLEKFMDFGFVNSILRADYFPPKDMWFTPLSINYYYFGHLITAILTKASNIPSFITYNLMIATIFAFTFVEVFSIAANLIKCQFFSEHSENSENQKKSDDRKSQCSRKNIFNSDDSGLPINRSSGILSVLSFLKRFYTSRCDFRIVIGGLLSAFLVTFAGNFHTIYTFFKPYVNENPVPFWTLPFSITTFPNSYWYPNATRFIYNTIHEFPIYSFVVSDLHGHVLDIPIVLLLIGILLTFFMSLKIESSTQNSTPIKSESNVKNQNCNSKLKTFQIFEICDLRFAILIGFILAIMYMTNVWDAAIYFLLSSFVFAYVIYKKTFNSQLSSFNSHLSTLIFQLSSFILILAISAIIFSLPFSLSFKPFASGIGVLCAPEFLTNIGKIGPFLFEASHCQRSPWWQLLTLYGFFYFWAMAFILFLFKLKIPSSAKASEGKQNSKQKSFRHLIFENLNLIKNLNPIKSDLKLEIRNSLSISDVFVLILIILSTLLIIIPEFIYAKDIYPAHYRANTMFKFVYQAFIMLSLSSGYIIIRIISYWKIANVPTNFSDEFHSCGILDGRYHRNIRAGSRMETTIGNKWKVFPLLLITIISLSLVMIYPYFAINSYYGSMQNYKGLNGISYLQNLYPTDYSAIAWINKNIKGQPVILEAQGDSYTDYARVSANTGLPTVLGWTVHEWLWRGTYDIPAPRINEVKDLYESKDIYLTQSLINKYQIKYVFIGDLEKQKYIYLNEEKFKSLGKIIYQNRETKIYELNTSY